MKNIISFLIGLAVFVCIIVYFDGWLVNLILDAVPDSAVEWLKLIRIGVWIVVLMFTFGIALAISVFIGGLINVFWSANESKNRMKNWRNKHL